MQPKRSPANRGQGRKPLKVGEPTVTFSMRLTASQRGKLAALGGGKWVRQQLDMIKYAKGVQK